MLYNFWREGVQMVKTLNSAPASITASGKGKSASADAIYNKGSDKYKLVAKGKRSVSSYGFGEENHILYTLIGKSEVEIPIAGRNDANKIKLYGVSQNNITTIHMSGPIMFPVEVKTVPLNSEGKFMLGVNGIAKERYILDKKDDNQITVQRSTEVPEKNLADSSSLSFNIKNNKGKSYEVTTEIYALKEGKCQKLEEYQDISNPKESQRKLNIFQRITRVVKRLDNNFSSAFQGVQGNGNKNSLPEKEGENGKGRG